MIPSLLLSLREGVEAALILGIVLGLLNRINRPQLKPWVWRGTLAAGLLAVVFSVLIIGLGMELEGKAEQVFEGLTMLLAAGVLTWMIFWVLRQGGNLKRELEAETGRAVAQHGGAGLFMLAFLAIFREGLELALILVASQLTGGVLPTLVGAALGLAGAAVLGWLLFTSTRRLSLKRFFQVTNILLILFAAGLVGYGIHELNEAGWIPAVIEPVYNLNPVLDESSPLGITLKTLFGYNGNPSLTEGLAYLGYLLVIWLTIKFQPPKKIERRPSAAG
jgi:high-affinity iron transporter